MSLALLSQLLCSHDLRCLTNCWSHHPPFLEMSIVTGLTSLPLPRRCLPARGPNAGSKLPECCRACGQCHQTLSSLSCTWDACRPPRGILESWSYSISDWQLRKLRSSRLPSAQQLQATSGTVLHAGWISFNMQALGNCFTGAFSDFTNSARTHCHNGCLQCSNECLRPGKSLVLVCRTASLHEDWNIVIAVMALSNREGFWMVSNYTKWLQWYTHVFPSATQKQTGQLGCQCGVFFPPPLVRQLALVPDILTGTALLSSPWHSALWVLSAGSLDTSGSLSLAFVSCAVCRDVL